LSGPAAPGPGRSSSDPAPAASLDALSCSPSERRVAADTSGDV
jgi:hypothetical protein